MGHLIFTLLHVIAVVFGPVLLFLTIPAHLIYAAVAGRAKPAPTVPGADGLSPLTHVRCPDCRELVRADAAKCKHCGTKLVPQDLSAITQVIETDRRNKKIAGRVVTTLIVGLVLLIVYGLMSRSR